jgi:hypothetical protein
VCVCVCEPKFLMNLNRVKHSRANVFRVSRRNLFLFFFTSRWINLNMNYLRSPRYELPSEALFVDKRLRVEVERRKKNNFLIC